MFSFKNLCISLFVAVSSMGFISCSTSPITATEFPSSADPSKEMNRLYQNIKLAQLNQRDVLSPNNFQKALDFFNQAKEEQGQNADAPVILHQIAQSQAYLDKANEIAVNSNRILIDVVSKRQNAIDSKAQEYFPNEFANADEALKSETKRIENNDKLSSLNIKDILLEKYSQLELLSVKRSLLVKAEQEKQMSNQIAKQIASQPKVTNLEEKYEFARDQFLNHEAEVYKQGNKLLIRLKGLSFPAAQSIITADNYSLLQKVQNVIKNFGQVQILIQGHTDSTGSKEINSKVSLKRAQAVESYLISNLEIDQKNVSAEGVADSKPIASNKTREGRAQNRRVDVIITPM